MTPQNRQANALKAFHKGYALARENQWDKALLDFAHAFELAGSNIWNSLFLGTALWQTGKTDEALQLWSLAADHDPAIRIAQYQKDADSLTRSCSQLADMEIRRFMTGLHTDVVKNCPDPGRAVTGLWPQTHFGAVDYPPSGPRPYMFFMPDLAQTSVFSREGTPWIQILEKSFGDIRKEFLALTHNASLGTPYINAEGFLGPEWELLKGQDDWTSIHLFKDGVRTPEADRCPKTCETLNQLPLVHHNSNPIEVFFSVLKPNTHIPPHFGLANSRLTIHLPLIIPNDCAIRVGEMTHSWVAGETFLFDDSHNHEAWNRSDQTRVVLIFEAWRPDMTKGEIEAVQTSFKARQAWLNSRRVPDATNMK
ncbi:MAG: aspartyl/asparaginyl beta-hydroxylase domain-containing protein [Alphaproteobacteria bacterium]